MAYIPSTPFTVPLMLLIPKKKQVKGVWTKEYPDEGEIFNCSFRTFGGTEREINSVYSIEDTAVIDTWYRPDIKADCAVKTEDGTIYEIIGTPEDIDRRHQYLKFKVKAIKGGA